MSLLSALFICSTDGGCKNALLNASVNDAEALFLYKIWDEIPDQKKFANKYLAILTNRDLNLELSNVYDRYLLALMFEKRKMEEAKEEYYKICIEAEGILAAECCYRSYKLGKKEAGEVLKEKFKSGYYLYFVE